MRVVLDVNVLVAALLSSGGPPARIVEAWREGAFEVVVSPLLIAELERTAGYDRIRQRLPDGAVQALIETLRGEAIVLGDPPPGPARVPADRDDEYLVALAATAGALLVSGDRHLLALGAALPVESPAAFVARLGS